MWQEILASNALTRPKGTRETLRILHQFSSTPQFATWRLSSDLKVYGTPVVPVLGPGQLRQSRGYEGSVGEKGRHIPILSFRAYWILNRILGQSVMHTTANAGHPW